MGVAIGVAGRRAGLVALLVLTAGCGYFKSEKTKVEDVVRDGLKDKVGKVPESLDIRSEGSGKYVGTAVVDGNTWDVTATASSSEIRWEARERVTPARIEKATRDIVRQETGTEPQDVKVDNQAGDIFKGTFTLKGQKYTFTTKVVGTNVESEWEPVRK